LIYICIQRSDRVITPPMNNKECEAKASLPKSDKNKILWKNKTKLQARGL